MERRISLFKKPAGGAARIGILYRSSPLENVQNIRKGAGSVENYCDVITSIILWVSETFLTLQNLFSRCFLSILKVFAQDLKKFKNNLCGSDMVFDFEIEVSDVCTLRL